MRIVCLQENLKDALFTLERISSKNQELPILNAILFKTENGVVKSIATDLEFAVEIEIASKVEKQGEVVVPVKLLSQFIGNLPNVKIKMEEKDGILSIDAENIKTTIPTLPKNEFPLIPKVKKENNVTINAGVLKKSLQQVINSAAVSYSIPEIAGVLFKFNDDTAKVVATDSFRLSEKTLFQKNTYSISQKHSFIIPLKTATELIRIITNDDEEVEMHTDKNQIIFIISHIRFTSRLITGEYPNYEQIIPKTSKTTITFGKEEFIAKLRLASVFASKINDVKLVIDANKNTMEISAAEQSKGKFESVIAGDMKGENSEVVFNYKYLLDGLSNIQEEEVVFEVNGPALPAVIKSKNDAYRYIVMPIKA